MRRLRDLRRGCAPDIEDIMKRFNCKGVLPILQIAIMELAKRRESIRAEDVAWDYGCSKDHASETLRNMAMAGRVRRVSKGVYATVQ